MEANKKLEFGNLQQIKTIKKEKLRQEAQEEAKRAWTNWKKELDPSSLLTKGQTRIIGKASLPNSLEYGCKNCLRLDCIWNYDSLDACEGETQLVPYFDLDFNGYDIEIECQHCIPIFNKTANKEE